MHWTAFWANATSGASSCEAQSCKCSNEQWLEESKTWAVPYFAHMSCCYIALFERISEIWNCTLLKVCILLFVFLCGTTVELADLANCICIFFVFFYATVELADVANWNEVACKECRDSPSRFSASLFSDGSVKSCSHHFLWGFWKNKNKILLHQRFFCLIDDNDL